MKIRLHGTAADCTAATALICQAFTVLAVSRPYPDRPPSRLVRVYLETTLPGPAGEFTVTCPACPDLKQTAGSEADATELAGGHDDTHHGGTVTAALAPTAPATPPTHPRKD